MAFGLLFRSVPTLAEINAMDRARFVATLGHLFEHSPWVAEETWPQRPFRDAQQLHGALCSTMRAAPRERQLALIRAHPDLAGRLAQQQHLTADSTREQASAGLHALSAQELAEFQRFNDVYRQKFGFPFVICARLNAKDAILAAMKQRLTHSLEREFDAALNEIEKIAALRWKDAVAV